MNQGIQSDLARVMPAMVESQLFTSLCTIVVPPEVFDAGGAPDPTATWYPYLDIDSPAISYEDIPCMAPPQAIGDTVQPTEVKELIEIMARRPLNVLLAGYYPAIIPDHRAVVDGVTYDILGVEHDSQYRMTRLAVQLATL